MNTRSRFPSPSQQGGKGRRAARRPPARTESRLYEKRPSKLLHEGVAEKRETLQHPTDLAASSEGPMRPWAPRRRLAPCCGPAPGERPGPANQKPQQARMQRGPLQRGMSRRRARRARPDSLTAEAWPQGLPARRHALWRNVGFGCGPSRPRAAPAGEHNRCGRSRRRPSCSQRSRPCKGTSTLAARRRWRPRWTPGTRRSPRQGRRACSRARRRHDPCLSARVVRRGAGSKTHQERLPTAEAQGRPPAAAAAALSPGGHGAQCWGTLPRGS
mmetsp:Transcript_24338/g.91918  ORF Transcript_24338/g.91918 Transcript_24338/m.91918 type:complete len:272 (+) Transcript_24338:39-854(+)